MAHETIDKILNELERVKALIEQFKATGKMPDIERDIVLSKLRTMYEFINLIQLHDALDSYGVDQEDKKKRTIETEPIENKPQAVLIETEIRKTEENIDVKIESPKQSVEHISHTTKVEEKRNIIGEQVHTEKKFVSDVLAQYVNNYDISRKLQEKPIKDLFTAIGLNDKFLYIRELFNNDSDSYTRTIEAINRLNGFNEAVKYIDSSFKWDFEKHEVQKFLELVRRRHPENEG